MRDSKFRQLLLLSGTLGAGLCGATNWVTTAQASCTSYTPSSGMTVTCSGMSNTLIIGSPNVTINFEDGAQHSITTGSGALVYEDSEINLYGSAAVTTSATGLQINWSESGNTNSTITLYGSSSVSSSGSGATIIINGSHSSITLNDQSMVKNTGTGDGIAITGTTTINGNNAVIVGENASVVVTGSSANAVDFFLGSNTLINYGALSSVGITIDGSNPSSTSDAIYNYGTIISSSGAAIALRGGNDRLTLGTGSVINGSIDGGDGTDDLTLVGSGSEDNSFSNFESIKMAGVDWILSGTNSFTTIVLESGIFANSGMLTATGGLSFTASGARLLNTGSLNSTIIGGTGADEVRNYGTISGAINLSDGDDSLTLGTGSNITGSIDGGDGTDDLTLVGSGFEDSDFSNFESLTMKGTDWTLSGRTSFTEVVVNSGTLTLTQGLEFASPGSIENRGTLVAYITGSSGADTVVNYGTIASSMNLSDGDDSLTLGTGSNITGSIDGGDGTDDLTLVGSGSEDSDFSNFESLTMNGTDWTLFGQSSFPEVVINSGILRINGTITGDVSVTPAGTLGGTGTIYGDVTSFGTLSAGNSVGTATIVGDLVQNGGSFVEFDAGGVDRWIVTGTATLVNNPTLTISSLDGSSTAYGVILHADGGITGSFADPPIYDGNGAVFLEQTANDIILAVVDGTAVAADHHASIETGLSFLDEVTEQGRGHCVEERPPKSPFPTCRDRFWAKAFGQRGEEDAHDGNKGYAFAIGGLAMGAEARAARDLILGASFGYGASAVEVAGDAGSTNIASILGAFYADARTGPGFFTASIGGGWQDLDLFRTAAVSSRRFEVESDTSALLLGGNVLAGVCLELDQGWTLTPTAGATYLHQWVGGYKEGIGPAAATIDDHDTGLLRLRAEVEARHSRIIEGVQYSPYLSFGLIDDLAGGGKASGAFSTGTSFELALDGDDELKARAGLGFDAGFENGSTVSIAYHAETSGTSAAHMLEAEIRFLW